MAEQARCQAITKSGGRCRAFALASGYCYGHDPAREAERQAARSKGGQMSGKLRLLRGKRAKLRTVAALVRFTEGVIQDVYHGQLEVEVARVTLYGLSIQRQMVELGELERRVSALEERARDIVR